MAAPAPGTAAAPAAALLEQLQLYAAAAERCCAAAGSGAVRTAAAFNELFAPVTAHAPGPEAFGGGYERWLEPVVELRVIGTTAALLHCVLAAAASTAPAPGEALAGGGVALDAARCMLRGLRLLEACASAAATVCGTDGPCDHLRGPLLEQLADGSVVGAVSRIPPFVVQQLWPRAGAAGSGPAGGAALQPPAAGTPQIPDGVPGPCADGRCMGGMMLASAARYAHFVLVPLHGASGGAYAARVGPGFLGARSAAGLLASLCAALLVAPPWCGASPDDLALDAYTEAVLLAQRNVVAVVLSADASANVARSYTDTPAARAPPDMVRFQRELLEQVAAVMEWDDAGHGGAGAATGDAGCGGASSAQQQQRQRWPLLSPHCLRLAKWGPKRLSTSLADCLGTAMTVPFSLNASAGAAAGAPSAVRSRMLAAVAAAEQLLPSRAAAAALAARVVAALCVYAQQLGPGGARDVRGLLDSVDCLRQLVLFRMRGAERKEVEACLPDLLAMHGWLAALQATPAGLEGATLLRMTGTVAALASCIHGAVFQTDVLLPIKDVRVSPPDEALGLWTHLTAGCRGACVQRLQATDLPRSLDRLVRWATGRGEPLGGDCGVRWLLHAGLPYVLGPLSRARLVLWRVRHGVSLRQQQEGAAAAGENSGARGGECGSGASEAGGGWCAREELGLALTALKLLRRESGRSREAGCAPELLAAAAPRLSLSLFVMRLACDDHGGLVHLLPELLALMRLAGSGAEGSRAAGCAGGAAGASTAAGTGAGTAAGGPSSGPGAADLCSVAQAVVACCAAALPVLTQVLEEAANWARREPSKEAEAVARARGGASARGGDAGGSSSSGSSGSYGEQLQCFHRTITAATAVLTAIKHLPADMLLELAPQRALVALARLHLLFMQPLQGQPDRDWSNGYKKLSDLMINAIELLSADERLVEGCVPGWAWARGSPNAEHGYTFQDDWPALSRLAGPSYTPRKGPIVMVTSGSKEAARFNSWRWRNHGQRRAEVAAFSRAWAHGAGLMDGRAWRAAVDAEAGLALWPPRLLRLCGYAGCNNYAGGCEAELPLQACSGCRGVRYCGTRCQKLHWRAQHKGECGRWAATSGWEVGAY